MGGECQGQGTLSRRSRGEFNPLVDLRERQHGIIAPSLADAGGTRKTRGRNSNINGGPSVTSNVGRNPGHFAYDARVKKLIAFIFALVSGLYLLTMGPMPDPLPIVDEATALLIFVKAMQALGVDLSRFIPFLGKKDKTAPKSPGPVVDV